MYSGLPNLKDGMTTEELDNLVHLSKLFQLEYLETICENRQQDQELLNESIKLYMNDETGRRMKELFFNKPTYSDIYFSVEGKCIFTIIGHVFIHPTITYDAVFDQRLNIHAYAR